MNAWIMHRIMRPVGMICFASVHTSGQLFAFIQQIVKDKKEP